MTTELPPVCSEYVSLPEVAKRFNTTMLTIARWRKEGLPAIRIGKDMWTSEEALRAFLGHRMVEAQRAFAAKHAPEPQGLPPAVPVAPLPPIGGVRRDG